MCRSQVGIPVSVNIGLLEGNGVLTMEEPEGLSPHVVNRQIRLLPQMWEL